MMDIVRSFVSPVKMLRAARSRYPDRGTRMGTGRDQGFPEWLSLKVLHGCSRTICGRRLSRRTHSKGLNTRLSPTVKASAITYRAFVCAPTRYAGWLTVIVALPGLK